ncbi:Seg1p [Nakaseomyces bracarensis]|uniref:Seg1p n=1 Tax=Nakaseomyces bracarensis TaxID=273131 RepID=UPI00387269AC
MFRSRNYNDQMRQANPSAVAAASALGNLFNTGEKQPSKQPVRSSSMMNMRRSSLLRRPDKPQGNGSMTGERRGSLMQKKNPDKRYSISTSKPSSTTKTRTTSLPGKRNSLVQRSGSFTRQMKNAQSTFNEFGGQQVAGVAHTPVNAGKTAVKMVTKYIPGRNGLIAVQVPATDQKQERKTSRSSSLRRPSSMTSNSQKNVPKRKVSQQSLHSHTARRSLSSQQQQQHHQHQQQSHDDSANPEDSFNRAVDTVDSSVPLIETSMREETEQELTEEQKLELELKKQNILSEIQTPITNVIPESMDRGTLTVDDDESSRSNSKTDELHNLLEDSVYLEENIHLGQSGTVSPIDMEQLDGSQKRDFILSEAGNEGLSKPLSQSEDIEDRVVIEADVTEVEEAKDSDIENFNDVDVKTQDLESETYKTLEIVTEDISGGAVFDKPSMEMNEDAENVVAEESQEAASEIDQAIDQMEEIPGSIKNEMDDLKQDMKRETNSAPTNDISVTNSSVPQLQISEFNSEPETKNSDSLGNADIEGGNALLKQQMLEENRLKESIESYGYNNEEEMDKENDITLHKDIVSHIKSNDTVDSEAIFHDTSSSINNVPVKEHKEKSSPKKTTSSEPKNMAQYLRSANPYLTSGKTTIAKQKTPTPSPKKGANNLAPMKSALKKSARPLSTTSSVYSDANSPADGVYLSLTTAENTRMNAKMTIDEPIDWNPETQKNDKTKRMSIPTRSASRLKKNTDDKTGFNRNSKQLQGTTQNQPSITEPTTGGVTKKGIVSAAAVSTNSNQALAEEKNNRQSMLKNRALQMAKQVGSNPRPTSSVPSSTGIPAEVPSEINPQLYPKEPLQKKSSFEKIRNNDKNLGFKKLSLRDSMVDGLYNDSDMNTGLRANVSSNNYVEEAPKLNGSTSRWKSRFQDSDSDGDVPMNAQQSTPQSKQDENKNSNGFSLFKKKSNNGQTFLKPPQPEFTDASSSGGNRISRTSSQNASPNKSMNTKFSKGSLRAASMQEAGPSMTTNRPNIYADIEATEKRIFSTPENPASQSKPQGLNGEEDGEHNGFGKKLKKLFGRKKH